MKKRLTAIIMAAALMLSAAACSTTSGQNSTASEASVASTASESKETESSDQQASQPEKATSIENWNEDSPAMKSIMAFVEEVTDEKSDKFVPAEKRIAVFDSDGTLWFTITPTRATPKTLHIAKHWKSIL